MTGHRGGAPTFEDAERDVAMASGPVELFGPPPEDGSVPPAATDRYRRLARALHPDSAPRGRGAASFTRLTELWDLYRETAAGGPGLTEPTLATRTRVYRVDGPRLARGHVADLYPLRHRAPEWREAVLKLPRSPRDNDLMEAEATALRRVRERGHERYRAFVPDLVESFRHRDAATGAERRANVLGRLRGFHTLDEVRRAHPDGVDPRDAAWMWRRLLVAVGNAAHAGVVHGAVVPEHVMVHPGEHGLVLVDWCYSVTAHAPRTAPHVPATVPGREDLYPPEVAARRPALPQTDIHMATRCVEYVTAGRLPRRLRAFARGCTLPAPERRPRDGLALLRELDEVLERLYGPRRFRPFSMPDPVPRP
ncbi:MULTISPECIES: J domain-containing protein [Nocardiopsis]|uniref:Molecular chaperone DnaJ n=1 Tax=Nocardiopsis sinuspersici TaxID=501010 RepID=A0A1V3BWY7_9ACTN|nr:MULTISPECIES: molecular chaperone DnaJ [Nocardiopsis]OOC53104.1 molecular chaperone DnaJ [Nocardiopsis sinuspersici]